MASIFINGPYSNGEFVCHHMLQGTQHYLNCNNKTIRLTRSTNTLVREATSFAILGISGAYRQIPYSVTTAKNRIVYTGMFPFIPTGYTNPSFGFLSCNDNPAVKDIPGNTYFDGYSTGLFKRLQEERNDVVVHLSDNVYLDSVWDAFSSSTIDHTTAMERARLYFICSYTDPEQGSCMRHGHQIQMTDDHDYYDGFGTPGYGSTETLVVQYQTMINRVHQEFLLRIPHPWIDIGAYRLLTVHTRESMRHVGVRFSDKLLQEVDVALRTRPPGSKIIACIPQPVVSLDTTHAYLQGLLFSDGVDESQHPLHRSGAERFTDLLIGASQTTTVYAVGGDVHHGYLQDYVQGKNSFTELVTSGITRSTRAYVPVWEKAVFLIQEVFNRRSQTTRVQNRRHGTWGHNYGGLQNGSLYLVRVGSSVHYKQ
jgi:hypothetical protein